MNEDFLNEYIHLEKLCNEMYGENHGISKYIEDMEATSKMIYIGIPLWDDTYKKLKELRWKRNQFVHEGKVLFDYEDIEWLAAFYQKIICGEDPISEKRIFEEKSIQKRNANMESSIKEKLLVSTETEEEEDIPVTWLWCFVAIPVLVMIGVFIAITLL